MDFDEKTLREFWKNHIYNGYVYHGTSTLLLPSIKKYGLDARIKPYDINDSLRLSQISKKVGALELHLGEKGIWVASKKIDAVSYSKQGPERIKYLVGIAKEILVAYRNNRINPKYVNNVTQDDLEFLQKIIKKYSAWSKKHMPVVLWIPYRSSSILKQVDANRKKMITNFEFFANCVFELFKLSRLPVNIAIDTVFFNYFHNRLLKKSITVKDIKKYEII